jgi:hypothetical protein
MIAIRLLLLSALAVWWMSACMPSLTETEARRLAEQRLDVYAQAERLDPAAFGNPEISSEPGHPWVFDYTSDTSPRHLVRIYVDSWADVEIHRMIEE